MRRHGRRQRERGGAARPRGRRAVESQGGAGPRGVPPRQCRRTQLRARLSSCAFSPPAPHARPSWCAGGGGTRSAPVAMRCGALTTPIRLQVDLDYKDADEQTFTEYCPHTFQALRVCGFLRFLLLNLSSLSSSSSSSSNSAVAWRDRGESPSGT